MKYVHGPGRNPKKFQVSFIPPLREVCLTEDTEERVCTFTVILADFVMRRGGILEFVQSLIVVRYFGMKIETLCCLLSNILTYPGTYNW